MLCSLWKGPQPLWAPVTPKSSRNSTRVFELGEGSVREHSLSLVKKKGQRAGVGKVQDHDAPPPTHTHTYSMSSKRLALRRDQLGGFSRRICHQSSCRLCVCVGGGCWRGIWDEGKICPRRIASAPPSCRLRMGGHPESARTPGPSPAAAAPTCLWGRGLREGPDVTRALSQSELPFPSPEGIPGPKQGPGARPSSDRPPT